MQIPASQTQILSVRWKSHCSTVWPWERWLNTTGCYSRLLRRCKLKLCCVITSHHELHGRHTARSGSWWYFSHAVHALSHKNPVFTQYCFSWVCCSTGVRGAEPEHYGKQCRRWDLLQSLNNWDHFPAGAVMSPAAVCPTQERDRENPERQAETRWYLVVIRTQARTRHTADTRRLVNVGPCRADMQGLFWGSGWWVWRVQWRRRNV